MKRFCTKTVQKLFQPIQLGPYNLRNRMAMAAMTRCRADPMTCVPNDLHVQYYSERAENAGLVLTECAGVSRGSNAFPGGCGIWTSEQVEGWKRVVDEVHKVDGRIFLQVFHGGRASKIAVTGEKPVAPSSIQIRTPADNPEGYTLSEQPEELTDDAIRTITDEFRKGAENALKAGFDGIQLHGANGYLIDEFLRDCSNKRQDKYGVSVENRCRFPLMVMDAFISVFGANKVGIKVSPVGRYQDMFDSNPVALYTHLFQELNKRKVGFVEVVRGPDLFTTKVFYDVKDQDQIDTFKALKPSFDGVFIGNLNITLEEGNSLIEKGDVDMISLGRPFIANPDLVHRFANGWKLAQPDPKTIYFGGQDGYIYPKYQA